MMKTPEQRFDEAVWHLRALAEIWAGKGGHQGHIAKDLQILLHEVDELRLALNEQRAALLLVRP